MKLLLFSDLHRDTTAAANLVKISGAVDVAIGAGDFATIHQGLDAVIAELSRMTCPAVLVPGNSETNDELSEACKSWDNVHVLHGSGCTIAGMPFYGLGGGVPVTPFGSWSYDFTEAEAGALLADCPDAAILVSHSPPKGAVDVSSSGQSLGSTAVRQSIEKTRPRLVVCGHIHESSGRHEYIGDCPVVNAGPNGIIWDLNQD
jgi:Icc-related predicted phosphoesterase